MFHLTDTSEFLGHSSDAVTSYFYLHFQDLRLANHLHTQIACSWQLVSEALGVGRTRAYRLRDNKQAFLRAWTELHDAELDVREPKPDPPAYQATQLIQAFSVGACPSKDLPDSTTAYTDAI